MVSIVCRIINKAAVIVVDFREGQGWDWRLFTGYPERKGRNGWDQGITLEEIVRKTKNIPVVLCFTGAGVIAKNYRELPERITGGDEFFWEGCPDSVGGIRLVFVRREHTGPVLNILDGQKVPVMAVRVITGGQDMQCAAAALADDFYREMLAKKRNLFAGDSGNKLAALVANRIQLASLVITLLLLGVNYLIYVSVNEKYVLQQNEHRRLERIKTDCSVRSQRTENMIREFNTSASCGWSRVADHIASLVPSGMRLETLAFNPLKKTPEELKPLQLRLQYVFLDGNTPEASEITDFTGKLAAHHPGWDVKLLSLDRVKDEAKFTFKIGIGL